MTTESSKINIFLHINLFIANGELESKQSRKNTSVKYIPNAKNQLATHIWHNIQMGEFVYIKHNLTTDFVEEYQNRKVIYKVINIYTI